MLLPKGGLVCKGMSSDPCKIKCLVCNDRRNWRYLKSYRRRSRLRDGGGWLLVYCSNGRVLVWGGCNGTVAVQCKEATVRWGHRRAREQGGFEQGLQAAGGDTGCGDFEWAPLLSFDDPGGTLIF